MFLLNVGSHKSHEASHPRRRHSLQYIGFEVLTVLVMKISIV
jgi:hypothetical protein